MVTAVPGFTDAGVQCSFFDKYDNSQIMVRLPPTELLDLMHDFPGPYLFKAMGNARKGFLAKVVVAVRKELNLQEDPPYTVRQSEHGKHVAVSFQLHMESSDQVLSIYRAILGVPGLEALF